ncbi:universal stress protein [Streptomyces collinus]|uniref:universal stress protein n=1 Tax=Streptomyces collinus TaxID=42684 RepID=UPI002942552C|nr:universal stress protein [Streptomyces collinus]
MTSPLVVGVDGSDSCLTAVDWAVDEAARHGAPLKLVYASLWVRYEAGLPSVGPGRPSEQVLAEHIVASAAERAERRNPDVKITTDIVPKDPADALVQESEQAFTLVTGSRGRGEIKGLLLGSVGLAVSARARCPVIVVRGDPAGSAGAHERILLGIGDADDTSTEAVRYAFREAEVRGCVLDVVHAWRRPAFDRNADRMRTGGPEDTYEGHASDVVDARLKAMTAEYPHVRTRTATPEGAAAKILVDRSAAADLVIVGARRRTSAFGFQLGRVSHALLHHARCPVAIVPEGQ